MEGLLNGMDAMDAADGNEDYLKSHTLDAERESFPTAWPESRSQLLQKLERKALEYGKLCSSLGKIPSTYSPKRTFSSKHTS